MQKAIYLDYNSTTPTDQRVVEQMLPYFLNDYGNPSNTLHAYGCLADSAVKKASIQVANLIHCQSDEITWNAGATEGNNTVVFGLIRQIRKSNKNEPIHLVTSNVEHWSVLNSFIAAHEVANVEITFVPVNNNGIITLENLKKYIKPETKLVSLIWVNNEIGSINPVPEIAQFCDENKIYFHTDATQAIGKIEVNLQKTAIHFLTFSAHKFYGPKGVGALFTRSNIKIEPFIVGGGQQHNRRSGTLNVPAVVGAGFAAELCQKEMAADTEKTKKLITKLYHSLKEKMPNLQLNGPELLENRSFYNLNLTMPQMIDFVLPALAGLAFSRGSACQTAEDTISHVLKAIGLTMPQAQSTIRFSIGRFTTEDEINKAIEITLNAFNAYLSDKPTEMKTL